MADPEATRKTAQRPNLCFVAIKIVAHRNIQAIYRTALWWIGAPRILHIRNLLLECEIEVAQGRLDTQRRLPEILDDAENGLGVRFQAELHGLAQELRHLN